MRLFVILIFLSSFFFAKAQTYTPMAEGERYWWYKTRIDDGACRPQSGFMMGISEDTLVNGLAYKKLFSYGVSGNNSDCMPGDWPCFKFDFPTTVLGRSLVGLIRDDIPSQKVYFLPLVDSLRDAPRFCSDEEFLLFDFGLGQGDSLNECLRGAIEPRDSTTTELWGVVDTITEKMYEGKMRKVLSTKGKGVYCGLLYGPVQLDIISGVGIDGMGLFQMNGLYNAGNGLATHLYGFCDGNWADCNIISSASDVFAFGQAVVSPNPVSDYLTVSLPSAYANRSTMYFYDVVGHFLRKDKILETEIDVSSLPKGLVFYDIRSDGLVIGRGSLVVE